MIIPAVFTAISSSKAPAASGGWGPISGATYDSKSTDVTGQEATPTAVDFKTDGTKMFVVGGGADDIFEYALSTAWDISTASYTANFPMVTSPNEGVHGGLHFNPSGLQAYTAGSTQDSVYVFNFSSAWDVTTGSYSFQNSLVGSQDNTIRGCRFKPDGLMMWTIGNQADRVHQYTLGTAWDISTLAYDSKSFYVGSQYVVGTSSDDVLQYNLGTAWDVSTAVYTDTVAVQSQPTGLRMRDDGTKFYIASDLASSEAIHQWSF